MTTEEIMVDKVTEEQQQLTTEEEPTPPSGLNFKNYGNLIFYVLNILITFGVGTLGWLGTPDNGELSAKYQTIITPKGSAFSIWGIIFTFQAIFAVIQMLPGISTKAIVQDGVGYWYIIVCVAQAGWTFSFAYEVIPLSLIFMIILWFALMALLISQYYVKPDPSVSTMQKAMDFWLLRFPFQIHGGWITAATALNVNVVAVDNQSSAPTQLALGIVSLAALHALSVWHLFGYQRPNYTIPFVLVWANGWIYSELQAPNELIVNTFDASVITGVAYAALSVAIIILIQLGVRIGFLVYNYVRGTSYLN